MCNCEKELIGFKIYTVWGHYGVSNVWGCSCPTVLDEWDVPHTLSLFPPLPNKGDKT